jgi:hypothetical protein
MYELKSIEIMQSDPITPLLGQSSFCLVNSAYAGFHYRLIKYFHQIALRIDLSFKTAGILSCRVL